MEVGIVVKVTSGVDWDGLVLGPVVGWSVGASGGMAVGPVVD